MERKTPPQTMQEKKRNEIMYILTSSFLASIESEDDKDMKLSLLLFFLLSLFSPCESFAGLRLELCFPTGSTKVVDGNVLNSVVDIF